MPQRQQGPLEAQALERAAARGDRGGAEPDTEQNFHQITSGSSDTCSSSSGDDRENTDSSRSAKMETRSESVAGTGNTDNRQDHRVAEWQRLLDERLHVVSAEDMSMWLRRVVELSAPPRLENVPVDEKESS
jgi:hypothetical protein